MHTAGVTICLKVVWQLPLTTLMQPSQKCIDHDNKQKVYSNCIKVQFETNSCPHICNNSHFFRIKQQLGALCPNMSIVDKQNKLQWCNLTLNDKGSQISRTSQEHKFLTYVTYTSRNQPKCNQSIYDYMRLVLICDQIWEYCNYKIKFQLFWSFSQL